MSRSLAVLAVLVACQGCTFAARSPELYRDDTKQVLESKNAEIRACYDGVLQANPGAGGKVTVKFDVLTETGKISNVTVDPAQTTAPEPVHACVRKAIEGLALQPADERKGEGSWTYEFAPPGGAAAPPAPAAPAAPGKT